MKKLEEELALGDNDTGLLSIDTKVKTENAQQPQVSPYFNYNGNPLVSQNAHKVKSQPPPQTSPPLKSSPVRGVYGRDEGYKLRHAEALPPEKVTQHAQSRPATQPPMIVQQVVQSPVYLNLAPGNLQQLPVTQVNPPNKTPPNQPLLIQNNGKGMTPVIIKSSDANFSPVIFQSNIINPESQTLMYTSAPIQGKIMLYYIIYLGQLQQYCML